MVWCQLLVHKITRLLRRNRHQLYNRNRPHNLKCNIFCVERYTVRFQARLHCAIVTAISIIERAVHGAVKVFPLCVCDNITSSYTVYNQQKHLTIVNHWVWMSLKTLLRKLNIFELIELTPHISSDQCRPVALLVVRCSPWVAVSSCDCHVISNQCSTARERTWILIKSWILYQERKT